MKRFLQWFPLYFIVINYVIFSVLFAIRIFEIAKLSWLFVVFPLIVGCVFCIIFAIVSTVKTYRDIKLSTESHMDM